jgi:hypothetical protein
MKVSYLVAASVVAASALAFPTAASAGEITGNGDPTGMRGHARSVCGFSGLEDAKGSPLHTQTPHEVWLGPTVGVVNPPPGTPGTSCNPNKGGGE